MYFELLKKKKIQINYEDIMDSSEKKVLEYYPKRFKEGLTLSTFNFKYFRKKNKQKKFTFYIYISSSIRGFYVNILNHKCKVLKHLTAGKLGYKKALRYNVMAFRELVSQIFIFFRQLNLRPKNLRIHIVLKGFNNRRNNFVKTLIRSLLQYKSSVISIIDLTDVPYNGCRPKKLRRK